jgi:hypothetical protein
MRFDAAAVRAAFFAAIPDNMASHVPVISHEDLCGYPVYSRYYGHQVADRLHATFPEAKILITIREQKSVLRSLYGQYVRQDGEWPIEMFLGSGAEPPGFAPICRLDHLEYDLLASHYARLFGQEQVLVLPYELLKASPIEFQQRIHDFAGTGAMAKSTHSRELVGHGALTLRWLRRLNRVVRLRPDWDGNWRTLPLSVRAKAKVAKLMDKVFPTYLQRAEEKRLNAFIDRRVAGYYGESNRRLQKLCEFDLASFGYDA